MKKHLVISLLVSLPLCAMHQVKVAEIVGNQALKKTISLVDAYMAGRLQAAITGDKPSVTYPDYMDASTTYDQSLAEAYETLTATYSQAKQLISQQCDS